MTWMLTGGAGYIGAHIVRAFDAAGLPVVVLDDLSTGIRANVPPDVPFVQASVGDSDAVRAALREHGVTGVLHLAAKKAVGESVEQPLLYWDENVGGMRTLLQSCVDEGVDRVLFSSSAAVFGEPPVELVTEETVTVPISPYGETKLVGEWMLRDLANAVPLRWAALREHRVTGVLHLAAQKAVAESVAKPLLYWDENVGGMRSLLQSCLDEGVDRVLFSSSAAVFGNPPVDFVTEETAVAPMSPYGETKLVGEWMLRDLAAATGLRWAALRYFNVAGTGAPELADRSVNNLVPMTFRALTDGRNPQLFGDDYDTRDGSCIRDYIHVVDLAEAHAAAAARLDEAPMGEVFNVGRGEGVTVSEVFATVREVTGIDFTVDVVGRRAGDPAAYFADATKIGKELGWTARLDLADMVRSAWEAWQQRD